MAESKHEKWNSASHYVVEIVGCRHRLEWYTSHDLDIFACAESALAYCRRADVGPAIPEETCRKIAFAYDEQGRMVAARVFDRCGNELLAAPPQQCACEVEPTSSFGKMVLVAGNSDNPCSPLLFESEAVVRELFLRRDRQYARCTVVDSFSHRIKDIAVPLCALKAVPVLNTPALALIACEGKFPDHASGGMPLVATLLAENRLDSGLGFRADVAMAIAGALDSGLADYAFDVEPPAANSSSRRR